MARKQTGKPADIAPKAHNDAPAIEVTAEAPAVSRGPLKFVAIRTCYHKDRLYKTDDIMEFIGPITPCPACTDGKKDGQACLKCKGTGRINPPHHFVPLGTPKAVIEEQSAEVEEAEIKAIRAQIRELGSDYDNRWTLPRLKQALLSLTKMNRKGA